MTCIFKIVRLNRAFASLKVCKFMTKNFQKALSPYKFSWESFSKVFSHEFSDFEIEYKINWIGSSNKPS
jgi:hypothetical protein